MAILNFVAGGTIHPCRFVKLTGANQIGQATGATDVPIGVSYEGTRSFPSQESTPPAATTNDPLAVYSVGEQCLVEAGGTITVGDLLESDSSGKAVAIGTTGTRHYAALALESGVAGERIRCLVLPPVKVKLS